MQQPNGYLTLRFSSPPTNPSLILQQLAWLGAALADPQYPDVPCCYSPIFRLEQDDHQIMKISYEVQELEYPEQNGAVKTRLAMVDRGTV